MNIVTTVVMNIVTTAMRFYLKYGFRYNQSQETI